MPTIQKFYFHNATAANSASGPGSGAPLGFDGTIFTNPPDVTATGAGTNRGMDGAIGVAQASVAGTTLAQTATQNIWLRRFISAPLATQSFPVSTVNVSAASSESNANSDFFLGWSVTQYRPSNGSLVATMLSAFSMAAETGTGETAQSRSTSSTALTIVAGDLLVVEFWRYRNTQVMATAYTNTFFYDGTTEASTTSNAAFIDFGAPIDMFVASTPSLVTQRRLHRSPLIRR